MGKVIDKVRERELETARRRWQAWWRELEHETLMRQLEANRRGPVTYIRLPHIEAPEPAARWWQFWRRFA